MTPEAKQVAAIVFARHYDAPTPPHESEGYEFRRAIAAATAFDAEMLAFGIAENLRKVKQETAEFLAAWKPAEDTIDDPTPEVLAQVKAQVEDDMTDEEELAKTLDEMAKKQVDDLEALAATVAPPPKNKGGRPKGSKNT